MSWNAYMHAACIMPLSLLLLLLLLIDFMVCQGTGE